LKNLKPRVTELQERLSKHDADWQGGPRDWRLKDVRGGLAGRTGKAQPPVALGVALCLAEEYEAGASVAALASKYNVHKSTAWRHLTRAGVETGQRFMSNNERFIAEVHAFRADGLTLRQIAARSGVSHPSVLRLLAMASA
jgi:lambda repressor-like predicted transcriptional regulator